jgi:hypothetical protein
MLTIYLTRKNYFIFCGNFYFSIITRILMANFITLYSFFVFYYQNLKEKKMIGSPDAQKKVSISL